jgi:hypothetical protein
VLTRRDSLLRRQPGVVASGVVAARSKTGWRLTLLTRNLRSVSVNKVFFVLILAVAITAMCSDPHLLAQGVQIEKAPGTQPGATSPSPGAQAVAAQPSPTPTAAEALYDYLQKYQIQVAKDQSGSRLVWTDRVFIEITDGFPPEPLATLLTAAPSNNGEFAQWVHNTFETQTKAWHAAKRNPRPPKQGTDELLSDAGKDHCFVNPVYVSYVLDRYPKASILIKGPTDPALFTVDGQLRAVVSPWTKLPDGTPLP